jgi:hypothetical protein
MEMAFSGRGGYPKKLCASTEQRVSMPRTRSTSLALFFVTLAQTAAQLLRSGFKISSVRGNGAGMRAASLSVVSVSYGVLKLPCRVARGANLCVH